MSYNKDKIDDFTLALLYLVSYEIKKGLGARAWKTFDWDTMDRLHEKGFISDPVGKAKSIAMTDEGFERSKSLFEKFFADE